MKTSLYKNTGILLGLVGLLVLPLSLVFPLPATVNWLWISLGLMTIGVLLFSYFQHYQSSPAGKNNGLWKQSIATRGVWGWFLGIVLTGFYIALYWYPESLGFSPEQNSGLVALFDPLSYILNGKAATEWFLYGTLYTFAILAFGIKFIWKYRNNRYQIIRTISVMFFQLGFAYLIPELLSKLNPTTPYFAKDLKNMWPLNYYFFDQWHLKNMLNGETLGLFFLLFGLVLMVVISPILTYFYGKRWYCSWVCGCGALAETAGDSFRQLSSKKISIWKLERWMIHLVLVFIFLTTIAVIWSFLSSSANTIGLSRESFVIGVVVFLLMLVSTLYIWKRKDLDKDTLYTLISFAVVIVGTLCIQAYSGEKNILFVKSYQLQQWYGFGIGAAFSGVLGVGFYPILGSRVWCRFGCPMAAILGLQQRLLSRFRITTNGGQCISCGNCSSYCEMGIDVRSYAQRGENIVRSSCVGCGICSDVCPRGVLKLENGPLENRIQSNYFSFGNSLENN